MIMRKYGSAEHHIEVDDSGQAVPESIQREGAATPQLDQHDLVALAEENRAVDGTD